MPFATADIDTSPAPQPWMALLFHRYQQSLLVTRHPIDATAGGPIIGAGAPLSARDIEEFAGILAAQPRPPATVLPPDVLVHERDLLTWWLPAARRPLPVRLAGSRDPPLLSLDVPWPALVLAVRRTALSVAAVKGRRRPGASTRLYHAPLMNVGADGTVCTGSAECPGEATPATRAAWTAVLTHSAFSHVNQPHTLRLPDHATVDTATHLAFWRALAQRGESCFPHQHLVPMGLTLGQFIERLEQRG